MPDTITVDELYQRFLRLSDEYRRLVRPDPEMLATTPEAEELCKRLAQAWHDYYYAKYPEQARTG